MTLLGLCLLLEVLFEWIVVCVIGSIFRFQQQQQQQQQYRRQRDADLSLHPTRSAVRVP
jgi:hypothetical protein